MTEQNKWDERYSEAGFAYGTEPNDFLAASLQQLPPSGTVLCLADGEGRNNVFLAQHGYTVTAVDSSSVGLAKAKTLAAERGVTITTCIADLTDYQLPENTYDAIISIFCHFPPQVRRKLHSRIPSSLKKGGVFLLEGYSPRQLASWHGRSADKRVVDGDRRVEERAASTPYYPWNRTRSMSENALLPKLFGILKK